MVLLTALCSQQMLNAQSTIKRDELLNINLDKQEISSMKIVEITFQAGQQAPRHQHPCPVVGRILSGTCLIQVEGQEPQILKSGDAFFEPAQTPVIHFDNYSQTEPLKFVAYYLINGDKELIKLLPSK